MNAVASEAASHRQREAYDRDGYVILRALFDPEEMREADAEAQALLTRTGLISTRNLRCRWQPIVETGSAASKRSIR